MLKDMLNLIYYNIKHAKLTPNAKKIAKKCELVNFKFKIVSIKIMKKPQVHHTGTETIKYDINSPELVYQRRQTSRFSVRCISLSAVAD